MIVCEGVLFLWRCQTTEMLWFSLVKCCESDNSSVGQLLLGVVCGGGGEVM